MSIDDRLRELFRRHYAAVARFVLTRAPASQADADALIAETFQVARRRLDVVPEGREELIWLLRVARDLSPATRRASAIGELAALDPLDRELVLLVAWDELTPAEAGEVLGLRSGSARRRLHRARRRLGAAEPRSAAQPDSSPRRAASPMTRSATRPVQPV